MELSGKEHVPLLFGGGSIAIDDLSSHEGNFRIPLLSGGSSVAIVDIPESDPTLRVPLLAENENDVSLGDLAFFMGLGAGWGFNWGFNWGG